MPRPVYTTLPQVQAKLPAAFLLEALDDDADGLMDDEVWQGVAEDAANQVDGRLGMRFTTPFDPDHLPAVVTEASLTFVLESLYLRRGFGTAENNPYLDRAQSARKLLDAIGSGEKPLTPEIQRPRPSVAVFTEPARTTSAHGLLST